MTYYDGFSFEFWGLQQLFHREYGSFDVLELKLAHEQTWGSQAVGGSALALTSGPSRNFYSALYSLCPTASCPHHKASLQTAPTPPSAWLLSGWGCGQLARPFHFNFSFPKVDSFTLAYFSLSSHISHWWSPTSQWMVSFGVFWPNQGKEEERGDMCLRSWLCRAQEWVGSICERTSHDRHLQQRGQCLNMTPYKNKISLTLNFLYRNMF